jgi:hypothetical protein
MLQIIQVIKTIEQDISSLNLNYVGVKFVFFF